MLSIICEANFKEVNDSFSKSKSYLNLSTNNHIENVYSNAFFTKFIEKLKVQNFEIYDDYSKIKKLTEKLVLEQIALDENENNELVSLAISCLQCFVQANWLGQLPQQTSNLPVHLQKDESSDISKKLFFLKDFFNNDVKFFYFK